MRWFSLKLLSNTKQKWTHRHTCPHTCTAAMLYPLCNKLSEGIITILIKITIIINLFAYDPPLSASFLKKRIAADRRPLGNKDAVIVFINKCRIRKMPVPFHAYKMFKINVIRTCSFCKKSYILR